MEATLPTTSLNDQHPETPGHANENEVGPGCVLDVAWRLNPQVKIRPESFGGLAYHCGTRRLMFLRSKRLVQLVRSIDEQATARAACVALGVADSELATYRRALCALADSGVIVERYPGGSVHASSAVEPVRRTSPRRAALTDHLHLGLGAPICLTWELTYGCNLACAHCLSSSGRRDTRELSTAECKSVIDDLQRMQVFYINVGGGEPTLRADFFELLDYATGHHIGVKFSTNGTRITPRVAHRLATSPDLDVQISLDGATAEVNDAVRGSGSYDAAIGAMKNLADAGFKGFKLSVVVTRHNVSQLDELERLASHFGAQLRLTRLRPSGRGAAVWAQMHPTAEQQSQLYRWLASRGERVLTGDSFFHLSAYGDPLPGINMCGAGKVVCLIDPVGDVYACPFAIHNDFLAGNLRSPSGFAGVWRNSPVFSALRRSQSGGECNSCSAFDSCQGGCMAAKFFTGIPIDGPDPECARGHGAGALAAVGNRRRPEPTADHSHRHVPRPVPVQLVTRSRAKSVSGLAIN
jgi:mycofactocin biosynthetic radical S-adenosylmethionine protein MftC